MQWLAHPTSVVGSVAAVGSTVRAHRHEEGLVTDANRPYWEAAVILALIAVAIWAVWRKK